MKAFVYIGRSNRLTSTETDADGSPVRISYANLAAGWELIMILHKGRRKNPEEIWIWSAGDG